jgi:hypothetical protein
MENLDRWIMTVSFERLHLHWPIYRTAEKHPSRLMVQKASVQDIVEQQSLYVFPPLTVDHHHGLGF